MIKERKINLIFLLLNFVLVVLGVIFVKNETFSALDDWITRKLYTHFFVDKNVPGNKDVALIKIDEKFLMICDLLPGLFIDDIMLILLINLMNIELKMWY